MIRSTPAEATTQTSGRRNKLAELETGKARLIDTARLWFCAIALFVVLMQPYSQGFAVALVALGLYGAISAVLWRRHRRKPIPLAAQPLPWVDFVCYAVAIEATGGLASPALIFILFPVAMAAFQQGALAGTRAALFCASLFSVSLLVRDGAAVDAIDVIPKLATPLLSLAGTVVAGLWARSEMDLMRRLALMNDIHQLFRPHQRLGHSITALSQMLSGAYAAEACLILIRDSRSAEWRLYAADEIDGVSTGLERSTAYPVEAGEPPAETAALLAGRLDAWLQDARSRLNESLSLSIEEADRLALSEVSGLLQGSSYVSLPLKAQDRYLGRLFVVSRGDAFPPTAVRCLVEAASQAAVLIDNVRLVDELAVKVASKERKRISRDLHDRTIQPYIGLKLGLEALRRSAGTGRMASELDELITMASDGIQELRQYVGALRSELPANESRPVLPAIREQAEKFSRFHGIESEVIADGDLEVKKPLHDQILNIVREGLANIWRHTSAAHATVNLHTDCGRLLLEFINDDRTGRIDRDDFFPRSIGERATELGGHVTVHRRGGVTAVAVEIPLLGH